MQRQAMEVSIKELRDMADKLEKEMLETKLPYGKTLLTKKCSIPIINKTNASDTWNFEK